MWSKLLLCLFTATLCLTADLAWACKCKNIGPSVQAMKRVDATFRGRLLRLEYNHPHVATRPTAAVFEVSAVWRGDVAAEVVVQLGLTSCAISWMKPGEEWLILAKLNDSGALYTRQCWGSRRLAKRHGEPLSDHAARWVERLGVSSSPKPTVPAPAPVPAESP